MKSLVVGASGFIGSHLVDRLLANGESVRATVRRGTGLLSAQALKHPHLELVQLDLADRSLIESACSDVHTIFHLASGSLPQSSNQDPSGDVSCNLIGTLNLLEYALKASVQKVVVVSSGGTVYGAPRDVPIREDHPTEPLCSYGITKLAIEKYIGLYRHLYGLNGTVLRVANPYGERQRLDSAQGAVPVFLGKALKHEPLEIWGDGATIRDFLYVGDVVEALLLSRAYHGDEWLFNIGSGCGLSLNDLIKLIEVELGRCVDVVYKSSRGFDVPANVLCIAKANEYLGWQPKVLMAEGLHRFRQSLAID